MSTPFKKDDVTFDEGRLVWGGPGKTTDKDSKGKALTTKDGKPRIKCDFGVAMPKNGTTNFWQTKWGAEIYTVALAAFPGLFDPVTRALLPGRKFSFKVTDGDSDIPNENGNKPRDQEGYAGCWVVAFGSSFVPRCVRFESGAWKEIPAESIKTGDYVQVAGSIDSNGDAQKSGVYVNHGLVAHTGIGVEIVSRGSIDPVAAGLTTAFRGQLPTSAAGPGAPAGPGLGSLPTGGPAPGLPSVGLPGVPAAGPPAGPTAVASNPSILGAGTASILPGPGAPAPGPGGPPGPVAPPPGPVMTAKATYSYESYKASGWSDDQLRAGGLMV